MNLASAGATFARVLVVVAALAEPARGGLGEGGRQRGDVAVERVLLAAVDAQVDPGEPVGVRDHVVPREVGRVVKGVLRPQHHRVVAGPHGRADGDHRGEESGSVSAATSAP